MLGIITISYQSTPADTCVLHWWRVNLTLQGGTSPALGKDMQTWQMIYLAGDLLSRSIWEGVCPEGWCAWRGIQLWLQALICRPEKQGSLAIDPLQLKWWCVWCIRDKKLDNKVISKMPVTPWRLNTVLLNVLTVWPRQLRPYLHQLWRMLSNGNPHCKNICM